MSMAKQDNEVRRLAIEGSIALLEAQQDDAAWLPGNVADRGDRSARICHIALDALSQDDLDSLRKWLLSRLKRKIK